MDIKSMKLLPIKNQRLLERQYKYLQHEISQNNQIHEPLTVGVNAVLYWTVLYYR